MMRICCTYSQAFIGALIPSPLGASDHIVFDRFQCLGPPAGTLRWRLYILYVLEVLHLVRKRADRERVCH